MLWDVNYNSEFKLDRFDKRWIFANNGDPVYLNILFDLHRKSWFTSFPESKILMTFNLPTPPQFTGAFFKRLSRIGCSSLMLLALAAPLPAADFTVYTDKTAFLAAVSPSYYTETFDSLALGESSPITLHSGAEQFVAQASGNLYVISGGGGKWLSTNNSSFTLNFTSFAGSPTAIGGYFFITDNPGNIINGTIDANLNSGAATFSVTTSSSTNFIGFVSTQNTPITLLSLGTNSNWVTANDLVVGQALAVPEPSTYALATIATGVMAYLARRRKARTA